MWGGDAVGETVEISTRDAALSAFGVEPPWLLKVDTQGYDRRVLASATETLESVQALVVELPVQPLYEGAGDWLEMLAWLRERGFHPRWFEPVVLPTTSSPRSIASWCTCLRGTPAPLELEPHANR